MSGETLYNTFRLGGVGEIVNPDALLPITLTPWAVSDMLSSMSEHDSEDARWVENYLNHPLVREYGLVITG